MRPEFKETYIELIKRKHGVSSHTNCSICSKCGGKCCKTGGCGLMTCDLPELTVEGITSMLDSGNYSITFFYTPIFGIIPTMHTREIGAGRINNSCIRKTCALLKDTGCSLSQNERPTLGLMLIPEKNFDCELILDDLDIIMDWISIKNLMENVIFEETGQTPTELFYKGCIESALELKNKIKAGIELTNGEIYGLQLLDACGALAIVME